MEVSAAFNQAYNDIQQLRVALAWVTDLIIEKGLFTGPELQTFFEARKAQAEAAMKAAQAQTAEAAPSVIITDPGSVPGMIGGGN
jgi:hypothetical protein